MRTYLSIDRFVNEPAGRVLVAGFFDGVHAGHRRVIAAASEFAAARGVETWALTFDQHPRSILDPEHCPPLLTPLPVRLERLAETDLDGCLMLPFTRAMAEKTPEDFIAMLNAGKHNLVAVFSGPDWRFGSGGRGDVDALKAMGARLGFEVHAIDPVLYEDLPVSSSRIRRAVLEGNLEAAAIMLSRPYAIRETVVRGRGMGRRLGTATANLHPDSEVLPPTGVYVIQTWLGDQRISGVANLGHRPTFHDAFRSTPVLELHLLDFDGDLYGCNLDIAFLSRLRDERRFQTPEALREQVKRDIAEARRRLPRLDAS